MFVDWAHFLRKLRKLGRAEGVEVRFERTRGRESQGTVYYGTRRTTLPDSGYSPAFVTRLLKELGIDPVKF